MIPAGVYLSLQSLVLGSKCHGMCCSWLFFQKVLHITVVCYSLWISYNHKWNLCRAVSCDSVYKWLKLVMAHIWDSSCQSCFVPPPSQLPITAPLESNLSHRENNWKNGEMKFSTGVNAFISPNCIAGLLVDVKENVMRKWMAGLGSHSAQQRRQWAL